MKPIRSCYCFLLLFIFYSISGCKKKNDAAITIQYTFTYSNNIAGFNANFTSNNSKFGEHWDLGDGDTLFISHGSSGGEVLHKYIASGTYNVTLTLADDNATKVQQQVIIWPNYYVSVSGTPIVGDTIFFHHYLPFPATNTYLWDFGDGSSSSDFNVPYHIYTVAGKHHISLFVNGVSQDSFMRVDITIYNDPIYTRQMTAVRAWSGRQHSYDLYDNANNEWSYFTDSTFGLTYIDPITILLNYISFAYDPDLSNGNIVVFSNKEGSPISQIRYDHVMDTMSIYFFESGGGLTAPPKGFELYWHSP